MTNIKIALDWTPNINHIGLFIARELGFYEEEHLDVDLIDPREDNYKITPGKKLDLGLVDFAIAPFETVISLNNKATPLHAQAVFAILQEDLSSIASLKSLGLNSPRDLDGKIYASYKARYEDNIVKELIKNDGGQGSLELIYPEKLGIWNTLLTKQADATWIFNNWEGIEAEEKGIELTTFDMKSSGIPYCYSPVLVADTNKINQQVDAYGKFIEATKKGYLYASSNQKESTDILYKYLTEYDKQAINLTKSLAYTAPYFGTADTCGKMCQGRVTEFTTWLVANELEGEQILSQELHTNRFF